MKSRMKVYTGFVIAVVALPLIVFAIVQYFEAKSPLAHYGDNYFKIEKAAARKVSPFSFVNQDGNLLSGDFVEGKVWVACYFFTTCPTICPKMITGMGDVQTAYAGDDRVRIVSFTVDPLKDTPEVLKGYADTRSVDTDQWNFVTGDKKELYRYARKELTLMATDGDGGPMDFIHSDRLVLLDQENYIRGYYDGTEPADVKQLIKDIDKLLKD